LTNDAINLQKSIKFQQEPNFLDYIFSFTDAMDIMKLDTNG
jgi:negative regulator of genetic competence, sporulation and motility